MRDELAPVIASLRQHLEKQRGLATKVGEQEAARQLLYAKRYFLEIEGRMMGVIRA